MIQILFRKFIALKRPTEALKRVNRNDHILAYQVVTY